MKERGVGVICRTSYVGRTPLPKKDGLRNVFNAVEHARPACFTSDGKALL